MRAPVHNLYWTVPVITFGLWITTIVGLLGLWVHQGKPQYQPEDASFPFISTVGANNHTFFIIFASCSAGFYILTTFLERHLRHARRIPGSVRKRQTVLDVISVVCAIIGAAALVLLSVFDSVNYSRVHWSMTAVFIVFVGLSVLFQTIQIFSLSKSHDDELFQLRGMAVIKSLLLGIAVLTLIVFVALYARCRGDAPGLATDTYCNRVTYGAAVCEWIMAFLLALFFVTYTVDLWTHPKMNRDKGLSNSGDYVTDPYAAQRTGSFNGDGTVRSGGPLEPSYAGHGSPNASLNQPVMREAEEGRAYATAQPGRAY